MIAFLSLFIHILASPLKTLARLETEIIMLRHQLNVLRRCVILLFANWLARHRANLNWWQRARFEIHIDAIWAFIARERIGVARSFGEERNPARQDSIFTFNSASVVSRHGIHFRDLRRLCLQENDRRFAGYDPREVRPTTIPRMIGFAVALSNLC